MSHKPQRGGRPAHHNKSQAGHPLALSPEPRLAAFKALMAIEEGRPQDEGLAEHSLLLSPRDAALCTALVRETLRRRSYLDWLVTRSLTQGRASRELRQILRLGLAQLLFFDRLGDHAIVMETVKAAKAVLPGRQGLVNAVLRGLIRERDSGAAWPPTPPVSGRLADDLALSFSYPLWLVQRLVESLGPAEAESLLTAGNQLTAPTLRLNPARGLSRQEMAARLPFPSEPTALSPWGLRALSFGGRPESWPGFAEGLFSIQDEASQLAGLLAGELEAGAEILDCCAGLGGKALHLAALYPSNRVTAADRDPGKLELLETEAARLGLTNIQTRPGDLFLQPQPSEAFALVLLDAPCSGLGVIRRRPDMKWNKEPEDIPRLAQLQRRLLRQAATAVKKGGRLLYSVCTFTPEEGPETAQDFLAAREDFRPLAPELWPPLLRPLLASDATLSLYPHRHQTDGFFWAVFERL